MGKGGPNTSLGAMHDILFQQLETLGNPELRGTDLEEEIKRADAISEIAGQIINNGSLALKAAKLGYEAGMMIDPTIEYLVGTPTEPQEIKRITNGKKVVR